MQELQLKSNEITVVIPCRHGTYPTTTLYHLSRQTIDQEDFKVIIIDDENKGACWARNKGFTYVDTEFVLFSDDDIEWKTFALQLMRDWLNEIEEASYCYGAYRMNGGIYCNREFDPKALRRNNYISTMSLIRTRDFPGFDESLLRLQDWDLWLTMLESNKIGVYCESIIYETYLNPNGISGCNSVINYKEAEEIVLKKHNL